MMVSTIAGMHSSLARLLRLARQATATTPHPVQTLPQLRELLDVSPQVMNAWKNRGVSKQGAIAAARVLGCTANAILDDSENAAHWTLPQQSNGGLSIPPVAQELSLRPYIVAPVIEWEQVMKTKTLPSEFEVVLVDDAMAPVAPKGTKARFSTKRQAGPGDAVLVTDDSGTLYFRVFHAGLHGEWEARPANSFHASLHSKQHGLRVVGVFVGLQASWAQLAR